MKHNRLMKNNWFMHLPVMITLLFVSISCINDQKQKEEIVAAIAPTKMNIMYIGVENPLDVAVSGYKAEEIKVNVTNGVIKGGNGKYVVGVRSPGIVKVTVTSKGDTIKEMDFKVKNVPDPLVRLAGKWDNCSISKKAILENPVMDAYMPNFEFDLSFEIIEFTLSTVHKGHNRDLKSNSSRLSEEQIALIKELENGTKIYITDIKALGPDGNPRPLSTIVLTIEE